MTSPQATDAYPVVRNANRVNCRSGSSEVDSSQEKKLRNAERKAVDRSNSTPWLHVPPAAARLTVIAAQSTLAAHFCPWRPSRRAFRLRQTTARVLDDETHVPARQSEAGANPRVPRAHGNQSRTPCAEAAARERACPTDTVALASAFPPRRTHREKKEGRTKTVRSSLIRGRALRRMPGRATDSTSTTDCRTRNRSLTCLPKPAGAATIYLPSCREQTEETMPGWGLRCRRSTVRGQPAGIA